MKNSIKEFCVTFSVTVGIFILFSSIVGGAFFTVHKEVLERNKLHFIKICLESDNTLDNCLGAVKELEK